MTVNKYIPCIILTLVFMGVPCMYIFVVLIILLMVIYFLLILFDFLYVPQKAVRFVFLGRKP